MMFKNSTKLLIANFSLVWKLILYYVIVCGITIGLIAPFFNTISNELNATGALSEFGKLLTNFNISVNPFDLLVNINEVVVEFFKLFVDFWNANPGAAFYICFILLYVFPFLLGLADLPTGQVIFGYMSSLTRYSFVGSYMRYFVRSVRVQLFKNLIMLPINLLIIIALIFTLRLNLIGGILVYFMPLYLLLFWFL